MTEPLFDLGDILSVTTGKLLSPTGMAGIYTILSAMTGAEIYTHQIPRAGAACAPVLLQRYPALAPEALATELAELDASLAAAGSADPARHAVILQWVGALAPLYGARLPVPRIPALEGDYANPVGDLIERRRQGQEILIVEREKETP